MNKTIMPEIFKTALNEQGFKTRQKKNDKTIMFWKDSSFKMSITFRGGLCEDFTVKAYVGTLSDNNMIRIGKACCIDVNPNLYMARLIVEKNEEGGYGLYVKIDYSCYTSSDVNKFIHCMIELLLVSYISASSYMRDKLGIINQ